MSKESKKKDSLHLTIETKVKVSTADDALLSQYAQLFSQSKIDLFNQINHGLTFPEANKQKPALMRQYGLSSRQFNSLVREVKSVFNSQKELLQMNLDDALFALPDAKRRLDALREKKKGIVKALKAEGISRKEQRELKKQLDQCHLRLWGVSRRWLRLKNKINRLRNLIDNNQVSMCFGSKKLFKQQFDENINHSDWRDAWRASRHNQFFCVGSKDETFGCQTCTLMRINDSSGEWAGAFNLRVRLPDSLGGPKHVNLNNVRFSYRIEQLLYAMENTAISFRLKRVDKRYWQVFATFELPEPQIITENRAYGAIGVDMNEDHLAVCETDRYGNPTAKFNIPLHLYGQDSENRRRVIGEAVAQVVDLAVAKGKPIVAENLDFSQKKRQLKNHKIEARYNRMLSGFAYSTFQELLFSRCFRSGVELIKVNPAYTSIIGEHNYKKRYGLTMHQAAALVIARRAMGLSEKPIPSLINAIKKKKQYVVEHTLPRLGGHAQTLVQCQRIPNDLNKLWRLIGQRSTQAIVARYRSAALKADALSSSTDEMPAWA